MHSRIHRKLETASLKKLSEAKKSGRQTQVQEQEVRKSKARKRTKTRHHGHVAGKSLAADDFLAQILWAEAA